VADDVTIGLIINNILSIPLVESNKFHSPFDANYKSSDREGSFKEQVRNILLKVGTKIRPGG